MNVSLEIGYEQLLALIRQLTPKQKKQLVTELQQETKEEGPVPGPNNLQQLLLRGPVWTDEEYENVMKTKAQLDQLGQHGAR